MLNPNIRIAKSKGIDLPILYIYTAGRIAKHCLEKSQGWTKKLVEHYKYYKQDIYSNWTSYPLSFLVPLNSGEGKSVDNLGLTSSLPPNLIWTKDIMAIERADVVVANMNDYMEDDINYEMALDKELEYSIDHSKDIDYKKLFFKLQEKIKNRRENFGTISEVGIALYLQKPVIFIVPPERKHLFEKHPFMSRASVIVTSVEQLIEEKWLQILYKTIAGAIYE